QAQWDSKKKQIRETIARVKTNKNHTLSNPLLSLKQA
ncbi:MAG: hypothetical protein RJA89_208, partial [Pseudomonadota bacterium]